MTRLPRSSDAEAGPSADTNTQRAENVSSETDGAALTPELVLVGPELVEAQRQTTQRKAAMYLTGPANEAFFVDPAEPVAPTVQDAALTPEPQPVAAPTPTIDHSPAGFSAGMVDVPLGTLIFRAGLLAEEQLEEALQEGMRTGKRLGEVLIARGWLQERDLGRLLAGQKGLPFVEITASDAEPAALEKLSEEKAKQQVALPLRFEDGQLVVAVADPSNELMLENLRRTLGDAPKLVVAPYADLAQAIGEAYARPRPEAPAEPEAVVVAPEAPQSESEPQPQAQPEPQPEPQPQPEPPLQPAAQAEPARAARPLPLVLPPQERAATPAPAPLPVPAMLRPPVAATPSAEASPQVEETPKVEETSQVDAPVVYAIETAPAPRQPEPQSPADPPAVELPSAPELILELPPDWPSPGEPAEEPATPAPPPEEPAPEPPAQEEPISLTAVVLRLRDGATLEVGTFQTVAQAAAEAQEIVLEIAATERSSTWPFFAQRYLRPDLIISVDLIAQGSVETDGLRRSQR